MSEDEDFSKIPVDARWRHAKWKARQSAYEEARAGFERQAPSYQPSTEDLKLCASDSNVIALEAGVKLLVAMLESLPLDTDALPIRQAVARPLAEKGLVAAKPSVKQASTKALLLLVEVADPAGVVEDLLAVVAAAKSPKAIAACIHTLDGVFREFAAPVTDPRPVLKKLPAWFAHTDRVVRQSSTALACALGRWVGEATVVQTLANIKPVQLSEVKEGLAKVDFSAAPPRLTRLQQAQAQNDSMEVTEAGRPEAAAASTQNGGAAAAIDPWDLAEPQDVLPLIPDNAWELVSSAKWKDRLEALESITSVLEKAPRLSPSSDYSGVVGELLRVAQKDMNQQCATQAIVGLTALAERLRGGFGHYSQRSLETVVERFKEKKRTAIDVIVRCIDAIHLRVLNSQFGPLIETVVELGMKHKTPQIRIESSNYICHVLVESSTAPKASELQEVGKVAVKLLAETAEPMRAAAANVLAALIKLAGPAKMASLLNDLDEHKMKRINNAVEKTTVKAAAAPAAASSQPRAAPKSGARTAADGATANPNNAAARKQVAAGGPRTTRPQPPLQPGVGGLGSQHLPARGAPAPAPARSNHALASPPSRRALAPASAGMDLSMGLSSPSPTSSASQRSGRPSLSSTPKLVKRTSTNADFTPARGIDTFRRRIYSPAKPQGSTPGNTSSSESEPAYADVREIAKLAAELELEKSLRLDAEKKLARAQVEKDREILRLQEELSMLKLQLKTQKDEFEMWLKNEERRWSQATLSSDDMGNRLSVLSLEPDSVRPPSSGGRPTASRRPPSRVLPLSVNTEKPTKPVNTAAVRTGNDDWERAVSMTHSLRQRVEQLKQQKQRNLAP